jgi:hypothetical protein
VVDPIRITEAPFDSSDETALLSIAETALAGLPRPE